MLNVVKFFCHKKCDKLSTNKFDHEKRRKILRLYIKKTILALQKRCAYFRSHMTNLRQYIMNIIMQKVYD